MTNTVTQDAGIVMGAVSVPTALIALVALGAQDQIIATSAEIALIVPTVTDA